MYYNSRTNQNVRLASKLAYSDHKSSGAHFNCTEKTFQALLKIGPASRRMLADSAGLPNHHITEYVKQLLLQNRIIEMADKMPCKISGRKVNYLKIKED